MKVWRCNTKVLVLYLHDESGHSRRVKSTFQPCSETIKPGLCTKRAAEHESGMGCLFSFSYLCLYF